MYHEKEFLLKRTSVIVAQTLTYQQKENPKVLLGQDLSNKDNTKGMLYCINFYTETHNMIGLALFSLSYDTHNKWVAISVGIDYYNNGLIYLLVYPSLPSR